MRSDSLKPSSANFEAAIGAQAVAGPARPATEATWMMCPDFCLRITGRTALLMATLPKKLVSNWWRISLSCEVFAESGDTESGIVDQHIDAAVVAHDGFDRAGKGIELGDVEAAQVELVAYAGFLGSLFEAAAAFADRAWWRRPGSRSAQIRWLSAVRCRWSFR